MLQSADKRCRLLVILAVESPGKITAHEIVIFERGKVFLKHIAADTQRLIFNSFIWISGMIDIRR